MLQYLRLYAFLAQVLPDGDTDAEKNFAYCKILARKIRTRGPGSYAPSDKLDLTHITIVKGTDGSIDLDPTESEETSFSDGAGSLTEDEKVLLSEVGAEANERFGKDFTDVHKIMGVAISEVVSDDPAIQEQAAADQSDEAFVLGAFDYAYMSAILDVLDQNIDFGKELLNNDELRSVMRQFILPLCTCDRSRFGDRCSLCLRWPACIRGPRASPMTSRSPSTASRLTPSTPDDGAAVCAGEPHDPSHRHRWA